MKASDTDSDAPFSASPARARSLYASERSGQFDLMMTRGGFPKARERARARARRALRSREGVFSHLQMGQKILEMCLHDRARGERGQKEFAIMTGRGNAAK